MHSHAAEAYDFDLDGIGDNQDTDDDNDGWTIDDSNPDADGDGVGSNSDPCVGVVDCAGVCNGGTVIDECGICRRSRAGNNTGNGTGGETETKPVGLVARHRNETGGETEMKPVENWSNVLPNWTMFTLIQKSGSPADFPLLRFFIFSISELDQATQYDGESSQSRSSDHHWDILCNSLSLRL